MNALGDPPAHLLADHVLFSALDGEELAALTDPSNVVDVPAGATLLRCGDPANCAYLVLTGRLQASIPPSGAGFETGAGPVVGDIHRGELAGEMALLTDEPRGATVIAVRDSQVLRIDREDFDRLLTGNPAAHRHVTTQLARRLQTSISGAAGHRSASVITLLPMSPGANGRAVLTCLGEALKRRGMLAAAVPGATGHELHRLEHDHDVVLQLPAPGNDAICCRQSDVVLLMVDARDLPPTTRGTTAGGSARRELLIVHPDNASSPRRTRTWLSWTGVDTHHHLRPGRGDDADRLARRLIGRPVALVLSGGAARGFAHLGVYRAITEAGVSVDAVGGSSAGSLIAAAIARGWDADLVQTQVERFLATAKSPIDLTLPSVALARGQRITERIQLAFGGDDFDIADLWLPFFCVSTNLSTADAHLHTAGPLWRAIRASVSIPALFPPMVEPEGVLVDGGLLDHLPVERMRRFQPDCLVVASDAGRRDRFEAGSLPRQGVMSGWRGLAARLRPRRPDGVTPGLIRTLTRLTALGNAGQRASGDLHIEHDASRWGTFDWQALPAIAAAGYDNTRRALDEDKEFSAAWIAQRSARQ